MNNVRKLELGRVIAVLGFIILGIYPHVARCAALWFALDDWSQKLPNVSLTTYSYSTSYSMSYESLMSTRPNFWTVGLSWSAYGWGFAWTVGGMCAIYFILHILGFRFSLGSLRRGKKESTPHNPPTGESVTTPDAQPVSGVVGWDWNSRRLYFDPCDSSGDPCSRHEVYDWDQHVGR